MDDLGSAARYAFDNSANLSGTGVASIFCTLLETAKLNELNPVDYLAKAVLAARPGETVLPLP